MLGLALFAFCFYQLAFVTRVVIEPTTSVAGISPEGEPLVDSNIDLRPVILIDPGHGGFPGPQGDGGDPGAVVGNLYEKHLTLEISNRLVAMLEKDGRFRIEMTRREDRHVDLFDRAKLANELDVALFVSIHVNTEGKGTTGNGVETWFAWPKPVTVMLAEKSKFGLPSNQRFVDDRGELLAQKVQEAVCDATGARDRGVKNVGHVVTRMVGAPAVLVECGFLTNPTEAKKLVDSGYQQRTARGIMTGMIAYLEEAMKDPMYGIHQPIIPEKDRILLQSGSE